MGAANSMVLCLVWACVAMVPLVVIVALGKADSTFASLAWGYVALRVVHSAIQCSYNKVNHRFLAFVASAVLLVWMWLRLALSLGPT